MSERLAEVLAAKVAYAGTFGAKAQLPLLSCRRWAILTGMDAWPDPAQYAGLTEGGAHVIRHAGGRASDGAIRSWVISCKRLGTREWGVIPYADGMMSRFTEPMLRPLLASRWKPATWNAGQRKAIT